MIMKNKLSAILARSVQDNASELVELTAVELTMVAGGLNPQPLPPRVDPEMRV
jgi:hypothetical protein